VKRAIIEGDDLVVVAARGGLLIVPRAIALDRDALKRTAQSL